MPYETVFDSFIRKIAEAFQSKKADKITLKEFMNSVKPEELEGETTMDYGEGPMPEVLFEQSFDYSNREPLAHGGTDYLPKGREALKKPIDRARFSFDPDVPSGREQYFTGPEGSGWQELKRPGGIDDLMSQMQEPEPGNVDDLMGQMVKQGGSDYIGAGAQRPMQPGNIDDLMGQKINIAALNQALAKKRLKPMMQLPQYGR